MRFLPTTFATHAVDADGDGDGDGTTNPHDLDDAAATAAAYICTTSSGGPIGPEDVARTYNPGSATYADELAVAQRPSWEHAPLFDVLSATFSRRRSPGVGEHLKLPAGGSANDGHYASGRLEEDDLRRRWSRTRR